MASASEIHPVIGQFMLAGPLSEAAQADFAAIIRSKRLAKGTLLLKIGQRADTMYFIAAGLARVYYEHADKDVTDYFAIDQQFIGAVPSIMTGLPSKKGIQLIEDSSVFYFKVTAFEQLCSQHHDLEHLARKMTQFGMLNEQERIESLRFYSMRERYELLEKKYPGIMNRCPLHFIASYLGTTQVSISRIRAGIQ
jgi:CRP-like cAMP-binding protein